MPAKSTTVALHTQLLDGFTVKSRKDGTVHTIRATDGRTVIAEVCVGKKATRLNLRALPGKVKAPKSLELSGKSKSWPGGGCIVTEANLTNARALLTAVTKVSEPTAAPVRPARTAAKRTRTARRTARATA